MSKEIVILTAEDPARPGGVEHLVRLMKEGFEKRGFQVTIFHRGNSVPPRWQNPSGPWQRLLCDILTGYFVGRKARRHLHPGVVAILSNGPVGWFPLGEGARAAKQIHFYHGTYRGQAEAIRPLITYRGFLRLRWLDSMLMERWSGRGKACLSNSEQTREEVQKFFGYESHCVWLPLDLEHFRPHDQESARRALGIAPDAKVGVFVGSTHPQKGFAMVRTLIQRFPEVHWLLALRGEVPEDLPSRPGVQVLQNPEYGRMPLVYSAADFAVCPSLYEPFGYVVAESLACGTPVVASPGGASDLFLRGAPLSALRIAGAQDVDAFAAAIQRVLADSTRFRTAVLEAARPALEEYLSPANWWRRFFETTNLLENGE